MTIAKLQIVGKLSFGWWCGGTVSTVDAGAVIREHRERANLSQEEVAAGLRVTYGAVSQWENGRTHPRRAIALKLDELLGAHGEVAGALGYVTPAPQTETARVLAEILERLAAVEAELGIGPSAR